MHPNVATAVNSTRWITNIEDLDELREEFDGKNLYSDIIISHNNIQTPDGDSIISSKLRIRSILNLYMYIFLKDFE